MTAESDLRRYRADANRCRSEISKASNVVATQRRKATAATAAAGQSSSASTVRMRLAEARRATKAANDAEAKRAVLEKKLADLELKVSKAQEKYEKERDAAQAKAIKSLQRRTDRASSQFALDQRLGEVRPSRQDSGEPMMPPSATPLTAEVFLSHATEDKDEIARPLKDALEARGVSVWFDELRIKVGQSIRREIEAGIANCSFGVVIVSPHFFAKQWTQAELDGLFGKKMSSGQNLVLPVWHHVSKDEVLQQSPLLAGILALNSATMTIDEMADALFEAVRAQH